jgi:hypothetical protein
VIYLDAFTEVRADVRYTYTRHGLEQDILLLERLPRPERFGLASRSTVLQVLTEFVRLPAVTRREERVTYGDGTEAAGEELDFGSMQMARGDAFRFDAGARGQPAVRVQKLLRKLDGRDFLIEQIPVRQITDELNRLPAPTSAAPVPGGQPIPRLAAAPLQLPPAPRPAPGSAPGTMLAARYTPPARAFVVDY